jgi:peptide/nickel transport system permease protein
MWGKSMVRFILQRLIRGLVSLILFQTILFGLLHALPYDFSSLTLGGPDFRAFIRSLYGLDLPLWEQYGRWLWGFARLDLGKSYLFWPTPVSEILMRNISRTLLLFLLAAALAYLFGIWLGKVMAWRRGGLFEIGATLGGVASYTSFAPWLGFVVLNIFGWYLGWFPYQRLIDPNFWLDAPVSVDWLLGRLVATGVVAFVSLRLLRRVTRRSKPWRVRALWRAGGVMLMGVAVWWAWAQSGVARLAVDVLNHLALPLITVVLLSFGETMMIMRAAMLETMGEDFVLMARAVGYPERVVRDRHAARNAILPVLTRLVLNLPFVLVGSLVIERVFLWHAMGQVIFTAIEYYDIPVLLSILSVVGVVTLAAHIVLDVLYVALDPRLRHAEAS